MIGPQKKGSFLDGFQNPQYQNIYFYYTLDLLLKIFQIRF